eukprot:4011671-Lingulodinium_polyedra.AAC.1
MKEVMIEETEDYEEQLKSYFGSYTANELNSRVNKTKNKDIFELLREIVVRGRNRSPVGLIALKHRVLNPIKASKISEIDKVLTDWRKDRRQVEEDDPEFPLSSDTLNNILLNSLPEPSSPTCERSSSTTST